jgi:hypothetical protein
MGWIDATSCGTATGAQSRAPGGMEFRSLARYVMSLRTGRTLRRTRGRAARTAWHRHAWHRPASTLGAMPMVVLS